jgi:hypothetical protein
LKEELIEKIYRKEISFWMLIRSQDLSTSLISAPNFNEILGFNYEEMLMMSLQLFSQSKSVKNKNFFQLENKDFTSM